MSKRLWLILAVLLSSCGDRPQLYYYTPEGYVKIANDLIKRRAVELVCDESDEHIEINRSRMDSHEYEWYENSYLRDDVRRFNEGDRDLFLTQGCSLDQVNPYAHVVRLPEPRRALANWLGKLFYAGAGVVGSLRSHNHVLAVLKPDGEPSIRDIKQIPVARDDAGPSRQPTGTLSDEARIGKFYFWPHKEEEAADVFGVGEDTAMEELIDAQLRDSNHLLVMGRMVPRGRVFALHEGDWIHFSKKRQQRVEGTTYLYTSSDLVRLLSASSLRNSRQSRTTYANTLGFVDDLVSVMNDTTRRLSELNRSRQVETLDIELSIDSRLQRSLAEKLAKEAKALQRHRPTYPVDASLAFADLLTGELLALPSYPLSEQDLAAFTFLSASQRRRFLSNQNFRLHSVGSAIKPFWAAATISRYPFLASLRIPAHGATLHYPTILGHKIVPPSAAKDTGGFETHGHGETDLVSYLAVSCNKYLIDQTTLALGVAPSCEGKTQISQIDECLDFEAGALEKEDQFSLATLRGREAARRPPRLPLIEPQKLALMRQQPLFGDFAELTGALVHSLPAQTEDPAPSRDFDEEFESWYRSARYHLHPWSKLIRYLSQWSSDSPTLLLSRFAPASPAAVNLGVNKIDRFRAEWVSMLLGGGTSNWTNIQLLEALARLVTGRRVRSDLIRELRLGSKAVSDANPREFLRLSRITEFARRCALLGMSRVVSDDQGTGNSLRPFKRRLEQEFSGYQIYLFAKTGTPTVSFFLPPAADRLVTTLFNRKTLSYDPDRQTVSVSEAGRDLLAKSSFRNTILLWIREMNQDLAAEGLESRFRRESPNYNSSVKLYLDGERLRLNTASFGQLEIKSTGGVFLLAALLIEKDRPITRQSPKPGLLPPQFDTEFEALPGPSNIDGEQGSVGLGVAAYFSWMPHGGPQASSFVASLEDDMVVALREMIERRKPKG